MFKIFRGIKEIILILQLYAYLFICFLLKVPFWKVLKIVLGYWDNRGLHSVTVGQFSAGKSKKRSVYREEMLLKTMLLFLNIRNKTCLDIACNDGFWGFRIARFGVKSVTGIDINRKSIIKANILKYIYDFPGFKYRKQDVLNFLDNNRKSYDVVLLFSVLYHLPANIDWYKFFFDISKINNDCLIIDSRWFENDGYWKDKSIVQTAIQTKDGLIKKWRPKREEIFDMLYKNNYKKVIEVNPSSFLHPSKEAFGDGNPYTLDNVSDYLTNNRTIVIAYKNETSMPDILDRLSVKYATLEN